VGGLWNKTKSLGTDLQLAWDGQVGLDDGRPLNGGPVGGIQVDGPHTLRCGLQLQVHFADGRVAQNKSASLGGSPDDQRFLSDPDARPPADHLNEPPTQGDDVTLVRPRIVSASSPSTSATLIAHLTCLLPHAGRPHADVPQPPWTLRPEPSALRRGGSSLRPEGPHPARASLRSSVVRTPRDNFRSRGRQTHRTRAVQRKSVRSSALAIAANGASRTRSWSRQRLKAMRKNTGGARGARSRYPIRNGKRKDRQSSGHDHHA
jgi:hypothetical protein